MRELWQLLEASNEDLPDIYCDMDQVLCNFMKGADEAVGSSFIHADKTERWNKINQTKNFWANLEWMPGGKRLWQFELIVQLELIHMLQQTSMQFLLLNL